MHNTRLNVLFVCLFVFFLFFKDQSESLTTSNSLKSTKIVFCVCVCLSYWLLLLCVYDYYLHFNR